MSLVKKTKSIEDNSHSLIREIFENPSIDTINLGVGQPDFDTPAEIKEAGKVAIDDFTGYTPNAGLPTLRTLVADRYRKVCNFPVSLNNVVVTAGATEALASTILT